MANKLVAYLPRTMPTLGGDQLYLQQELAAISNAIASSNTAIAGQQAAWKTYIPTVMATSGTLGTTAANGRYLQVGKTVFFSVSVNITSLGTASGYVNISLPAVAASFVTQMVTGRENAVTGNILQGMIPAGASVVQAINYNNTGTAVAGYQLLLSGHYEAA